jgi:putative addiction module CopG family antidote
MGKTDMISIVLADDLARLVREKVASGRYATEADVVRDGLEALKVADETVETWLRDRVAGTFDAWRGQPDDVRSLDDVRHALLDRPPTPTGRSR